MSDAVQTRATAESPSPAPAPDVEAACPLTFLGSDREQHCLFLDPFGHMRGIPAAALANTHVLRSLFRGDESWLRRAFPRRMEVRNPDGSQESHVIGYDQPEATAWLIRTSIASSTGA